ncbi:peptide chain release factor family protein [Simkania sp.]|uniref:peptide chain release factor family protein n=1 Tax=Simkania sp. TaxID=34094 RepID=UPI003B529E5F
MPIRKEKLDALHERMEELGIREEDLIEKFILGSGKGGQKVNKTASCVYLKHIPTQIEVKCQQDRSREMNRFLARRELCEQIASKIHQEKTAKQQLIEKIRRQKKKRSKRAKEKMLKEKKKRSEIKSHRSAPTHEENYD